tara:strand:+ start:46 stop:1188 length:1143 start_codon:yes stop_codon:yes gene_type:complete
MSESQSYLTEAEIKQRSGRSVDQLKTAYAAKKHHQDYFVVRRGGVVTEEKGFKDMEVTEDALFDAETLFDTMIPDHKLQTPYIGQGNTQPFNKLIREHKLDENVHKNFAEKFLQGAVEAMCEDGGHTAEGMEALKNAYNGLVSVVQGINNAKYKHMALRNISCSINELAIHEEYVQAQKNEELFDSDTGKKEDIEKDIKKLRDEIENLKTDTRRAQGSSDKNFKKLIVKTKINVVEKVEALNEKIGSLKLVSRITNSDYDQNKACFYAFTTSKDNGKHIGVYELFRNEADDPIYCHHAFKTKLGCNKSKGFGKDIGGKRFSNRQDALKAAIEYLTTEMRQDNYDHINYFRVYFHGSEAAKQIYEGNYFHLSPKIRDLTAD